MGEIDWILPILPAFLRCLALELPLPVCNWVLIDSFIYPFIMLYLELAASVGALVSTSVVLYLATHPEKDDNIAANSSMSNKGSNCDFRGMKKYSSYHRIRHYATTATTAKPAKNATASNNSHNQANRE